MKKSNNDNPKLLKLSKISIASLHNLQAIKGGGNSIDDPGTDIAGDYSGDRDPKDFSQLVPDACR